MRRGLLAAAIAAACFIGGKCGVTVPDRQWDRGDYHPMPENTKPWALPKGLETRAIIGYDDETETSLLPLSFTVINTTSNRINAVLPAGLIFEPDNTEYQYMLILQTFAISVPPDMDTTFILPTFCANEMSDEPDDESNYVFHSREWDVEINELLEILKGRKVTGYATLDLVQEALFEITDGNGLTDSMRTHLRGLP